VRDEAGAGHRTFVVVPLIEEEAEVGDGGPDGADGSGRASRTDASAPAAEVEAARLGAMLAPLRVGLIHGRMKAAERDRTMTEFRDGNLDVLVGTTVIEVGVDVPEATMMIVEGADRFGLAQLHQLRGRVGRGTVESFCVLVSDSTDEVAQARLRAVAELRDGFELAEKDWLLRGEGNVLGLVQSGLPRLRIATLERDADRELARLARAQAETLLGPDGAFVGGTDALVAELEHGWLERVWSGDDPGGAA
jgi:ATP-dependent DNA helicase RecG